MARLMMNAETAVTVFMLAFDEEGLSAEMSEKGSTKILLNRQVLRNIEEFSWQQ